MTNPGPVRGDRVRREVVSYVRRSARMRPHQRQAWDAYRERFVIDVARVETSTSVHPEARIDLASAYGRVAPLVVEIGPGTGESLIPMAKARPDVNVLAFEVYQPAIAQLLAQLVAQGLDNVRIVEADAAAGVRHLLPDRVVDEVWTFFPDPWHKAKHHKRRLLSTDFVDVVADRMVPGGRWRLATDWADYAAQMRMVLDDHPAFVNEHGVGEHGARDTEVHEPGAGDTEAHEAGAGWAPRWADRPVTRFEQRGLDLGRRIFDLSYRRADH